MSTVIAVENLGKKYLLRHQSRQEGYLALRDVLTEGVKTLGRRLVGRGGPTADREEFWALRDVSFEVKQGDRIGVIGRNGAGKSTLLKILSRICEPTTGSVRISGRVASLLEVGTGFHPELSGRENIYLNGAILGMSRAEIRRKFDEIVDFAEVEKFLDTPVKRYSSGMYVRLAFAVAAHLEPEILIVDEVLAVGDLQFQKKCLGKMEEVSTRQGRTVLFVSHNMSAIQALCSKALLLDAGTIAYSGDSGEAISRHYHGTGAAAGSLLQRTDRTGSGRVQVAGFKALDSQGKDVDSLFSGADYTFQIDFVREDSDPLDNLVVSLDIYDEKMSRVMMFRSNFSNADLRLEDKRGAVFCAVRRLPLARGTYHFSVFFSHRDAEVLDFIENVMSIQVAAGDFFGTGSEGMPSHCRILHDASWSAGKPASTAEEPTDL